MDLETVNLNIVSTLIKDKVSNNKDKGLVITLNKCNGNL